jgi:hypothetical protein
MVEVRNAPLMVLDSVQPVMPDDSGRLKEPPDVLSFGRSQLEDIDCSSCNLEIGSEDVDEGYENSEDSLGTMTPNKIRILNTTVVIMVCLVVGRRNGFINMAGMALIPTLRALKMIVIAQLLKGFRFACNTLLGLAGRYPKRMMLSGTIFHLIIPLNIGIIKMKLLCSFVECSTQTR